MSYHFVHYIAWKTIAYLLDLEKVMFILQTKILKVFFFFFDESYMFLIQFIKHIIKEYLGLCHMDPVSEQRKLEGDNWDCVCFVKTELINIYYDKQRKKLNIDCYRKFKYNSTYCKKAIIATFLNGIEIACFLNEGLKLTNKTQVSKYSSFLKKKKTSNKTSVIVSLNRVADF